MDLCSYICALSESEYSLKPYLSVTLFLQKQNDRLKSEKHELKEKLRGVQQNSEKQIQLAQSQSQKQLDQARKQDQKYVGLLSLVYKIYDSVN